MEGFIVHPGVVYGGVGTLVSLASIVVWVIRNSFQEGRRRERIESDVAHLQSELAETRQMLHDAEERCHARIKDVQTRTDSRLDRIEQKLDRLIERR